MRQLVAAGTALVCFAAVGCAKKSDDAAPGSSTAPSGSASAPVALSGTVNDHGSKDISGKDEFELEQDDFYFGPTYIKATGGKAVKVELHNEGSAPHTFTIDALHVDQTLQPGKDATVMVTIPASGAVAFYCKFHKSQGMQGAFYVNAGDTVVPAGGAPSGSPSGSGDSGGAYGQ
jgi:plastocyanin